MRRGSLRVVAGKARSEEEHVMKKLSLAALAVGLLVGSAGIALAQGKVRGMSQGTPGHEMQRHGSMHGSPGASGYAPGHLYNRYDSDRGDFGRGDRDRMMGHHSDRGNFDRDRMTRHHGDHDFGGDRD